MADTTRKKPIDAEDVPAPAAAAVDDKPSESANAAKPAVQTAKPAAAAGEDKPEENPTADPKTEASVEKTEGKADPSVNKVAEPAPAAEVAPEDEKKVATGADKAPAPADDAPVAPAKDAPADVAPADEGESLEQRLAEAEARAAEAERKLAVAQVGFELGLPAELATRLQGTTEAEIKKDAKALIDAINAFKAAQPAEDAEDEQDDSEEEETPLDRNGRVPARGRKSNTDSDTMDAIGARMFRR
nr:MAG TPA: protein of unknown function (DUF4355) [Caudoviricetes sp.]